jgi:methylated-DNA-[protein]-cysteine S-methyltransferase
MQKLTFEEVPSPVGPILTVFNEDVLCALDYVEYESRMRKLLERRFGLLTLARRSTPSEFRSRLDAYFAGDLQALQQVEVSLRGSAFQERVWNALRAIPPGRTAGYGELAANLGCPSAARAVGMANSLNPIAIVVPCHRVVGANGKLTGYAGGLERKRWLLDHERRASREKIGERII